MITPVLIFFGIIAMAFIGVLVCTIIVDDKCKHSYKRIDDCNDKNVVLVCHRCGKIKKLRK